MFDQDKISIADVLDCCASNAYADVLGDASDDFFFLSLVVDDGDFYLFGGQELSSEDGVSGGNGDGLGVYSGEGRGDSLAYDHHSGIAHLGVALLLYLSSFADRHEAPKHVPFWDHHIIHDQIAVVLRVEAEFRADVSGFDPGQQLECFLVSDGHYERVDAMVLAEHNHPGKDKSVSGPNAEIPGPKLGG